MRKIKGFTLAEVLITLGIVGVIAAISMPTFIANTRNQANASKLSSTISDLENAFTSMLAATGSSDLTETDWYINGMQISDLSNYIKVENGENAAGLYSSTTPFKRIDGGDLSFTITSSSNHHIYQFKNGAVMFFVKNAETFDEWTDAKRASWGVSAAGSPIALIYIDVNGSAPPNTAGRDFFNFYLDSEGKLYPNGSLAFAYFDDLDSTDIWTSHNNSEIACNDYSMGDGFGCTARLVENSFKMDY